MSITTVTTLITNIKNQIATATGFTELKNAIDPEKAGKRLTKNRYSVLAGAISEISGVTKYYTVDQIFTVKLTDDYVITKANDSAKQVATNTLFDKAHDSYIKMIQTKAGTPAAVMNVKQLEIGSPEYFEAEDTVLLSMNFVVTYRQAI